MRPVRLVLALTLTVVAAAALGAASGGDDDGPTVRAEPMVLLADPQAQRKLHLVTDAVQDWAESGARDSGGYAGTVIDSPNRRADIYWKGPVPSAVTELIEAKVSPGLTVALRPGAYSRNEMTSAIDRFTTAARPETWTSVGPKEDGSGIAITYDPARAGRFTEGEPTAERYAERAAALAGLPVTARQGSAAVPLSGSRGADVSP
ncbi:hypothetical protein F4556_000351 [Kitasatospora gansuensis]|uniref:Uncharacterized protein n=1 Tax=Kitasatospora gansuensis TaxID=258050 RepID=A0A7W7S8E7_9ACTN|nr:hypothetical protein [Kitasatospora gansuensis]MBB4944816.1 hypothetical protein [Kitasatospora gansuensis]